MNGILYRVMYPATWFVFKVAVRQWVLGKEHVPQDGPVILAITHLSHNDPIVLGVASPRQIDYMARSEAFTNRLKSSLMHMCGAFCIHRSGNGPALPGLREALRRLEGGRLIGVFPEGEVMRGPDSALNGGPIKYGATWLSRRKDVPIVPCVVLGSRSLHSPVRWLPLKLGRTWVAFGEPILPNHEIDASRAGRQALGEQVKDAWRGLHARLHETFAVPPLYRDV